MFVRNRNPMLSALMGGGLLLAANQASAEYALNLPQGATAISHEVYDLHMWTIWICVWIGVVVFGAMLISIVKHRKSKGAVAAQFHESTTVEIIWTVIPFLILISIAVPATKTLIAMEDTKNADITIKATGYQWKWGYDYLREGISFYSSLATPRDQLDGMVPKGVNYLLEVDNPMVVPVGKKVRIILTASDVIHAWWVPALGVKQDAIPGFVRDSWFKADKPGTYRGQCAELCGKDHGYMPIVVEAVEPEKYALWVAEQQKKMAAQADDPNKVYTLDELRTRGEKVYAANCQACHQASGMGQPPAFPALSGSKVARGPKAGHIGIVLSGKPGTAMASFKQLSDVELAAVVTYERNAWNNKSGDMVAPSDIKAQRK